MELKKDKVYRDIKQAIINAELPVGEKLPRETDLAKSFKVGRITLRSSLDRLEYEGYIKRIHGKGTFVSPENIKSTATPTIMVVRGNDYGFEAPHNYIIPEIIRFAENIDFKIVVTTNTALLMFSASEIKNYVKENNVVGIIAIMNGFIGDEPILEKFCNAGVPVVFTHCLRHDVEITGFNGIIISEKDSWDAAINYLAECGHKNIGLLGNQKKNGFRSFTKPEGLKLLEKHGATPVESLLVNVPFDKEIIKKAVRKMFSIPQKPTAILCFSDFYAIYVYEALKEMKLRIPEDVAVMGTCGYPDAELLSPPLSTVDYGYSEFARMAMEMFQEPEKWFSDGKGKVREKPFKLRKRKSTSVCNCKTTVKAKFFNQPQEVS